MPRVRVSTGLFLIVALAAVGLLLVTVPPWLVGQYEQVKAWGPTATYVYFGIVGVGAAILLGITGTVSWRLWRATRNKALGRERQAKNPSQLSGSEKRRELADNLATVDDLQADPAVQPELRRELEALVGKVEEKQAAQTLEIVAFGTISSGKSSLLNALAGREVFQTDPRGGTTVRRQEIPWPGDDCVRLVDTPGLGEVEGAERVAAAAAAAKDADLVLMVVDGPLRESEHRLLARLGEMEKRVLLCLNKADWYEPEEQDKLLGQLSSQVRGIVEREDVLAVRSQPVVRARVRVLAGGGEQEEQVTELPDIEPLAARMLQVVRRDGHDLLLANLLLQSRGLVEEARRRVQEALDRRAWEIVDRYTWACGAAAALSPLPLLDLFASSAMTVKMVVDLGRVYRQEVDADVAINLLAQLGKNLIAILGVHAATPLVAGAVASLVKSVPIAGTIAGGALQGLVQALVTRWIGSVFIHYYKSEMQMPADGLANVARREWQRLTSPAELLKFVQQAREKFGRDR
jgi:small GTP-binding protein